MYILNIILQVLMGIYILIFPLVPMSFSINGHVLSGDSVLYIVSVFILLKFIINLKKAHIKNVSLNQTDIFFFILYFIMVISIIYSSDKTSAFNESLQFSAFVLIYFNLKYGVKRKELFLIYIKSILAGALIVFLDGLYQYIAQVILYYNKVPLIKIRIGSALEQANNLGVYSILMVFPCIMLFIYEKRRKYKAVYGILSFFAALNIFLSGSRNAMIGLFIGFVIITLIYNYRLIYINLILPLFLLIPQFRLRFIQIGDMSQNVSRIKIWETVLYMIKDHPIRGIGIGNFYYQYPRYVKMHPELMNTYDSRQVVHCHNIYLKYLSEAGIFGFMAFILFIAHTLINLKNYIKLEKDVFLKTFFKGILISLIVFLCMNMSDNFFSSSKILSCFFIFTGLMEGCRTAYINENHLNPHKY